MGFKKNISKDSEYWSGYYSMKGYIRYVSPVSQLQTAFISFRSRNVVVSLPQRKQHLLSVFHKNIFAKMSNLSLWYLGLINSHKQFVVAVHLIYITVATQHVTALITIFPFLLSISGSVTRLFVGARDTMTLKASLLDVSVPNVNLPWSFCCFFFFFRGYGAHPGRGNGKPSSPRR